MPEFDEFGIEMKKPIASDGGVDEFGIPIKKKSQTEPLNGVTNSASNSATGTKGNTYKLALEGIVGSPAPHATPDDIASAYLKANPHPVKKDKPVNSIDDFNEKYKTNYNSFEEFTTSLPDKDTRKFFEALKPRVGIDRVAAYLDLYKKNGSPKIKQIPPSGRSYYDKDENTMYLTTPDHFIDELAHSKQNKEGGLGILQFYRDLLKAPHYNQKTKDEGIPWLGTKSEYETEGTAENEAHKKIAPELSKQSDLIENKNRRYFFGANQAPADESEKTLTLPRAELNTTDKNGNTNVAPAVEPPAEFKAVDPVEYLTHQFNKKNGTDYTTKQITGKEKIPEPLNALEAAGKNIMAASDKIFSGAVKLPMNATRIIANPLLTLAGVDDATKKDMMDSFENTDAQARALKIIGDHYEREGDKLEQEVSANVNMKPKTFVEAANKYATKIAGFLPYLLALPVTGEEMGFGLMASEQRNSVQDNPHMSEGQKDANATMIGLINSVAIPFASKMFSKNFSSLVEKVGMDEAKMTVAKSVQKVITDAVKPYTAITKPLTGAATGIGLELGNHFANQMTDPDYKPGNLQERLLDAGTTFGLFQAAGIAGGEVYHGAISKVAQAKLKKAQSEVESLDNHLQNPELSNVAKESLEGERQKKMNEVNNLIEKEDAKVDGLLPERKAQVVRLTNEAITLERDLSKLKPDDAAAKIIQKKIDDVHKEKDAIIEDNKNNPPSIVPVGDLNTGTEHENPFKNSKIKGVVYRGTTGGKYGEGKGYYFTTSKLYAESYMEDNLGEGPREGSKLKSYFVDIKNPLIVSTKGYFGDIISEKYDEAINNGHDGIIAYNPSFPESNEIVAFDKTQTKEIINDNSKAIKAEPVPENAKENIHNESPPLSSKSEGGEVEEKGTVQENSVKNTGIKHEETAKLREEMGIPEYERSVKSQEALEKQAQNKLKTGYDVKGLLDKLEKGAIPTDVEHEIMKNYLAGISAKIDKNPTDALIKEARRAIEQLDKAGTEVGRSLAARRGLKQKDETLMDYFMQDMDANKGAPLTEQQKEIVQKEHEGITKAKDELQDKLNKLQGQYDKLKAEGIIAKAKSSYKRSAIKKTHEEHVTDRQKIIADMKEKLAKSRKEMQSAIIPYAMELVIVAPDVAKMVESYVHEGVDKLDDLVKEIHSNLKDAIPDITDNDVKALIAGNYNQKKLSRNEIAEKIFDLKQQARLTLKLEDLQNGKEPDSESKRIKRNQEIESLRNEIKEHDLSKISDYKKRINGQIEKLEQELKNPEIKQNEKPAPLKLDKEATELRAKYIKLKQEREVRILKQQFKNRSLKEKAIEVGTNILNIPRAIESSLDFSAVLRQAVIPTVSHPVIASKALKEMFHQAFSQKRFDEWFQDLHEDPRYPIAEESGLYITDPHDPKLSVHEEAFMSNIVQKVPVFGSLVKGSERAYAGYLNKMRWDLFNLFSEQFQENGKTIQNSPELYKGLAKFVNASTGRGSLGVLEEWGPVLNSVMFSPKLVASRVNFLNPFWYGMLPKEVRYEALKDFSKFVATGTTLLSLMAMNDNVEVSVDPRNSDFGKIKIGKTRWDIWGGEQQIFRFVTQVIFGPNNGNKNKGGPYERTRLDVMGRFARSKLSPAVGMGVDLSEGKDFNGNKITPAEVLEKKFLPLLKSDIEGVVKEQGPKGLITGGLPALFGVGVSTYDTKKKK